MRIAAAGLVAFTLVSVAAASGAGEPEARKFALEQDRLARDPSLLRIAGHDFDPLAQASCPGDDRASLCGLKEVAPIAASDAATWLVQVTGRPVDARPALESAGVLILGYYPNDAWLVRAPASRLADIARLPAVRWVGAWSPAWKVEPGLLTRAPRMGETELALRVELQPGARIAAWKAHLEATPGATIVSMNETDTEPSFASLEISLIPEDVPAATRWLASLRDVMSIGELPRLRPFLDGAVPWLQTGIDAPADLDTSAKLFARGITGRGILVGLADDGLENDDCRLVYDSATDEAAWPLGPAALSLVPVADEEHFRPGQPPPVRTRERKVVAYYVETGAAPYSSNLQHGTKVAGCILGDAHDVLASRPLVRDVGDKQDVFPMNRSGEWLVGEELRADLLARIDDPATSEPGFPTAFGALVQHHEAGDGVAPGAQLVMQDMGDVNGQLVNVSMNPLMHQAHGTGATAYNISWGGDACTDCYVGPAADADRALWKLRDLSAAVAVGNDGALGPESISFGVAQAKSVTSVGATEAATAPSCASCVPPWPRNGEDRASYSALGPSSGGRITPEVMAPGSVVVVHGTTSGADPQAEDGSGTGEFGCGPMSLQFGTSFSAGNVTGLSALVQQYFRDGYYPSGRPDASMQLRPTNALVRAVIVNSSRDLRGLRTGVTGIGLAHRPNFAQGWGAPRLDDTLYFAGDPTHDDPLGDTERARLVVLTDTPNGFDGSFPLVPEPGGRTRDAIVANFQRAISDGAIHEFFVNVANPDPADAANELRITLAWSDAPGLSASAPLVNDLDLEVISPGPDGVLQSTFGSNLLGDDRVYRTNPLVAWSGGSTQPSTTSRLQAARTPFDTTLADADRLNTLENVFIPATEVFGGPWRVRVIGYSVPAVLGTADARPNFVLNDRPSVIDLDGDGTPDLDIADGAFASDQGYALIASGNFVPPTFTRPRVPLPPRQPPRRPPEPPRGPRP